MFNDFTLTKKVRLINSESATQIEFPADLVVKKEHTTVTIEGKIIEAVVLHLDFFAISNTDEFKVSNSGVSGYITGATVKDYFRNSGLELMYPDIFDPRFNKRNVRVA